MIKPVDPIDFTARERARRRRGDLDDEADHRRWTGDIEPDAPDDPVGDSLYDGSAHNNDGEYKVNTGSGARRAEGASRRQNGAGVTAKMPHRFQLVPSTRSRSTIRRPIWCAASSRARG
jgi:hypothetical protein